MTHFWCICTAFLVCSCMAAQSTLLSSSVALHHSHACSFALNLHLWIWHHHLAPAFQNWIGEPQFCELSSKPKVQWEHPSTPTLWTQQQSQIQRVRYESMAPARLFVFVVWSSVLWKLRRLFGPMQYTPTDQHVISPWNKLKVADTLKVASVLTQLRSCLESANNNSCMLAWGMLCWVVLCCASIDRSKAMSKRCSWQASDNTGDVVPMLSSNTESRKCAALRVPWL